MPVTGSNVDFDFESISKGLYLFTFARNRLKLDQIQEGRRTCACVPLALALMLADCVSPHLLRYTVVRMRPELIRR